MPETLNCYKFFLYLSFLVTTEAAPLAANNPVVDLGYAQYEGTQNILLGVTTYYGIPYAAPPTGSLRWQPPVDIEVYFGSLNKRAGPQNATTPGSQCPQIIPPWQSQTALTVTETALLPVIETYDLSRPSSEDCLLLDVIIPSVPKSSKLPVIVQIHGGGYDLGNSQSDPGQYLVSVSDGMVIYVQIQYRLGPYGWLSSKEIRANGTANAGLLDQRSAFNWVQRHIGAFGGDPDQVTIWGPSAGGSSVTNHLISYGGTAKQPFIAAIAEYPFWNEYLIDDDLEQQYDVVLQATGCADLACLRALPSDTLGNSTTTIMASGYSSGLYGFGSYWFGPSVDGEIIQDLPSNEFRRGHFSKMPLLTDHHAFEGFIFTNTSILTEGQVQPDLQGLWTHATQPFFNQLFQLYPLSDFTGSYWNDSFFFGTAVLVPNTTFNSPFYQLQTIYGDAFINCPTYAVTIAMANAGFPVWKLRFDAGVPIHGQTLAYLFPSSSAAPYPEVATMMKDYFLSFAITQNPNTLSLSTVSKPAWPPYGPCEAIVDDVTAASITELCQIVLNVGDNVTAPISELSLAQNLKCDFFFDNNAVTRS